ALQGVERIHQEVEKGHHSVMATTRDKRTIEVLRVGVVGVGARSRLALNAELEGNGGAIVAVCEPHHLARRRVADRLGKDPDSIVITSD
ncbi:oxidoreductase, partial [Pseudomonas sp. MPR-E5]